MELWKGLLNFTDTDKVKDTAHLQADELMRHEAALRMSELGRQENQKQDNIYHVSRVATTLSGIVLLGRQSEP